MKEGNGKLILLAEDNLVNQKVGCLLLQHLGLDCEVVDNGARAIQAVERHPYAVVLMDCQMPVVDGFEATRAIRKLEAIRGTYTPIIAVTALAMVGDRERCISVGMDDYISKPIDREILKIKLNHWLQKDFVVRNQELAQQYASLNSGTDSLEVPINLAELDEFWGASAADVLNTFLEQTDRLLHEIDVAVAGHQDSDVARMAHELKGSSASVGAKSLAKLTMYLERPAGIRDWPEARDTNRAISSTFAAIREFVAEQKTRLPRAAACLPGPEKSTK